MQFACGNWFMRVSHLFETDLLALYGYQVVKTFSND